MAANMKAESLIAEYNEPSDPQTIDETPVEIASGSGVALSEHVEAVSSHVQGQDASSKLPDNCVSYQPGFDAESKSGQQEQRKKSLSSDSTQSEGTKPSERELYTAQTTPEMEAKEQEAVFVSTQEVVEKQQIGIYEQKDPFVLSQDAVEEKQVPSEEPGDAVFSQQEPIQEQEESAVED